MTRQGIGTLVIVLAGVVPAFAQGGTVRGYVRDQQGGALPGATLTLTTATTAVASATTDGSGSFRLANVPAGTYKAVATMQAFADGVVDPVTVTTGGETVLTITLQIAGVRSEITIAGTRIRGVSDVAAPAFVLSAAELARTGATRTEDFLRFLPENFDSLSSEAIRTLGVAVESANATGSNNNSVNLRGLGPGSTLILVDGRRRAGRSLVNVNTLPAAWVEQIEVVTGGRSGTYGSDAVAGVVNIVTRRRFSGVEGRAEYGGNSHGVNRWSASTLAGLQRTAWGATVGYSHSDEGTFNAVSTGLMANPDSTGRSYTVYPLRPDRQQDAVMGTARWMAGQRLELFGEGMYTRSETLNRTQSRAAGAIADSINGSEGTGHDVSATLGARLTLPRGWLATADAHHARLRSTTLGQVVTVTGANTSRSQTDSSTKDLETLVTGLIEGPLRLGPLSSSRAAFGVEYRRQQQASDSQAISNGVALAPNVYRQSRRVWAGIGELSVPLIAGEGRPGLRGLDLLLAGRVERFSDFGTAFSPQTGVTWRPVRSLAVRASYSDAYRAPNLALKASPQGTPVVRPFTDPRSSIGTSIVLYGFGTKADIGPERGRTWTAGASWSPSRTVSATVDYYRIRYRDRIAAPVAGTELLLVLQRESIFGSLITRQPTAADLDLYLSLNPRRPISNSTTVTVPTAPTGAQLLQIFPSIVLFDSMQGNLSDEQVEGIDMSISARRQSARGEIGGTVRAAYTFNHFVNITPDAPDANRMNEVGKPVDLRIRAQAWVARGPWSLATFINHVPSYANPFTTPAGTVEAWTTADVTASFDLRRLAGGRRAAWRVVVAARNVFDQDPPPLVGALVSGQVLKYDATNATGEGRVWSASIVRGW